MKKFFSLLLTLALVLSLAACGGGNGGSDAGTNSAPCRQRRYPDPAACRGRDHHRGRSGLRL